MNEHGNYVELPTIVGFIVNKQGCDYAFCGGSLTTTGLISTEFMPPVSRFGGRRAFNARRLLNGWRFLRRTLESNNSCFVSFGCESVHIGWR